MRKLLLLLSALLLLGAEEIIWEDTFLDAKERAKSENRPIMLMYTMSECGACRYMKHVVFVNPRVIEYINTHFTAVEVDIDEERVEGYKPAGTPTFFFLRPDGTILEKVPGAAKPPIFLEKLEEIVKRYKR